LDRAFNPKCLAVVGDRREGDFRWLRAQSNFKGKLYSVQVNPESIKGIEALGIKNYTSLLDIPGPIDLVIVAVPRAVAPQILEDCIKKEVAAAHFFTAGFAESDTEEGKKLDKLITEKAIKANFHLIGPNCMGIFNPEAGIKQVLGQYDGFAGPVGFISQSGNNAIEFSFEAHDQGVDINKSVSFGNGVVINAADYLEYFNQDDDNKIIGMYLEGLRDGQQFLSVLKRVTARKPVVIWKGGRTGVGERAIASHTASLAISQTIWDTAMRQCGAINVVSREELIDTLKALTYLSPVFGNRVGITGGSGGQSVAIADAFAEATLEVPVLTQKSRDELASFFRLIGGGFGNPIDTGNENRREMRHILEVLKQDANIDNLVMILGLTTRFRTPKEMEDVANLLIETRQEALKPVMLITPSTTLEGIQRATEITPKLHGAGVPVFASFERAARALRNAREYYRFKNGISTQI